MSSRLAVMVVMVVIIPRPVVTAEMVPPASVSCHHVTESRRIWLRMTKYFILGYLQPFYPPVSSKRSLTSNAIDWRC